MADFYEDATTKQTIANFDADALSLEENLVNNIEESSMPVEDAAAVLAHVKREFRRMVKSIEEAISDIYYGP